MSLTLGIVGLPNVGKSTLFNALTKNDVLAANYPFATIEPNVGVVELPDPRLNRLAEIFGSQRILPATVSFVDIAGIVKGASEGAGLGNKFLANIREAEAICQVVRVFADDDVIHVDGRVDPLADIEIIETELILADIQTLEKALPRLEKEAKKNKELKPQHEEALKAQAVLDEGNTLFSKKDTLDFGLLRELNLMTTKPFLYVFNADESVLTDDAKKQELRDAVAPADCVFLDAKSSPSSSNSNPTKRRNCSTRSARTKPDWIRSRASDSTPSAYRPTSRRAPRKRAPGPSLRRDRAAGGRCHPLRLRARVHQGRDRVVRRSRRRRFDGRGQVAGQGAHGGQGLRHGRRRRGRVPLQCVALLTLRVISRPCVQIDWEPGHREAAASAKRRTRRSDSAAGDTADARIDKRTSRTSGACQGGPSGSASGISEKVMDALRPTYQLCPGAHIAGSSLLPSHRRGRARCSWS